MSPKILFKYAVLWLFFAFIPLTSWAQGWCVDANTVMLDNIAHPTASETVIYKNAVSIDEIDIPIYEDLALQVHYPTDLPANERRPLVVLVHGGFFIGGSLSDFTPIAQRYAQAGFIAATVDYRLCKRVDCLLANILTPCNVSFDNSLMPSAYVAVSDVNDAIRYLQNHSSQYKINPNKVIVGGHSAGAVTALNAAYLDPDEIAQVCQGCGTWPDYLAEALDPVSGIKAIIPMSGMIYNTNWIDADEANISALLLHGTSDGVVGYGYSPGVECCAGNPFPNLYGACPIAERLDQLGANYELITGSDCSHDVYAGGLYVAAEPEVAAFIIKTVMCQQAVQKHVLWECSPAQAMCPPFPYEPGVPANVCNIPLDETFDVLLDVNEVMPNRALFNAYIADNTLHIDKETLINKPLYAQISNINGKIMQQQMIQQTQIEIDISTWAKGIYIVQLLGEQKQIVATQKVLRI